VPGGAPPVCRTGGTQRARLQRHMPHGAPPEAQLFPNNGREPSLGNLQTGKEIAFRVQGSVSMFCMSCGRAVEAMWIPLWLGRSWEVHRTHALPLPCSGPPAVGSHPRYRWAPPGALSGANEHLYTLLHPMCSLQYMHRHEWQPRRLEKILASVMLKTSCSDKLIFQPTFGL
jgi:hypothetical protein